MNVGVTGASGFVGGAIVAAVVATGWNPIALGRREARHYDLARPVGGETLSGLDVLVHAAYDSRADNVAAVEQLVCAARTAGLRKLVFVSSFASDADADSAYGREKYLAESRLDGERDLIVRPGLVAGTGGLYGSIRRSIRRFGIAPVFGDGAQPVYLVDVGELARAFVALIGANAVGTFACAAREPIGFTDLCAAIASASGRRVRRLRIPTGAALAGTVLCERLGLKLPISSESVRGIANLKAVDVPRYPEIPFAFSSAAEVVARVEKSAG